MGHEIAYNRSAIKLKKCNLNLQMKKKKHTTAAAVDESVHSRMRWKIEEKNYASLVNIAFRENHLSRSQPFRFGEIRLVHTVGVCQIWRRLLFFQRSFLKAFALNINSIFIECKKKCWQSGWMRYLTATSCLWVSVGVRVTAPWWLLSHSAAF